MTRYDALGETAMLIVTIIGMIGVATAGLLTIEALRAVKKRLARLRSERGGPALPPPRREPSAAQLAQAHGVMASFVAWDEDAGWGR